MIYRFLLSTSLSLFALTGSALAQDLPDAFPFCEDRKCGLMDATGAVVLEPTFDNISQFSSTYFEVTSEGESSLITAEGAYVKMPSYDNLRVFSDDLYVLERDDIAFLVDKRFERVSPGTEYDSIGQLEEGYAIVTKNRIGGIIRANGEEVLPVKYPYLSLVGQGKAVAQVLGEPALIDIETADFRNGIQFREFGSFAEGRGNFRNSEGLYGYVDLDGEIIIPAKFSSNLDFENGTTIVNEDGARYVIDKSGESVFDGKTYGTLSRHGPDMYQVSQFRIDQRGVSMSDSLDIGLANASGELVVDYAWPGATYPNGDIFAAYVRESEAWALFDVQGNQISEAKYQNLSLLSETLAWTYGDDNKDYVINLETGERVSPRKYDSKRVDSDGFAYVKVGELRGLVGPDGTEIVPPIFEDFYPGGGTEFGYMLVRVRDGEAYPVLKDGTPIGFSWDEVKGD